MSFGFRFTSLMRASSPIWASLARTRERGAELLSSAPRGFAARSRVLARLAPLAQIGELARRLRFTEVGIHGFCNFRTKRCVGIIEKPCFRQFLVILFTSAVMPILSSQVLWLMIRWFGSFPPGELSIIRHGIDIR